MVLDIDHVESIFDSAVEIALVDIEEHVAAGDRTRWTRSLGIRSSSDPPNASIEATPGITSDTVPNAIRTA